MDNLTYDELVELRDNPTFKKLKLYLMHNSNQTDPSTDIELIAKRALIETGQMEVFRVVEALLASIVAKREQEGLTEVRPPFEHHGEPTDVSDQHVFDL